MKIALGTVQFGLDYGVANSTGKVAPEHASLILDAARRSCVDTVDTAIGYGDSEGVLGRIGVSGWRVVSKLPAVPTDVTDVGRWVTSQVAGSLSRLRVRQLHGLLLHAPKQLLEPTGTELMKALVEVKRQGLVAKIGVSIYEPADLDRLLRIGRFDIVQAPLSILDRRLVESGWARRLKESGVELHTRSAFLQGLLLMRPGDRPARFARWQTVWDAWDRWLAESNESALSACLKYVLAVEDVDRVVVGVDDLTHLRQILQVLGVPLDTLPVWPPQAADSLLINPSHWNAP